MPLGLSWFISRKPTRPFRGKIGYKNYSFRGWPKQTTPSSGTAGDTSSRPPPAKVRLAEAAERLVRLYDALDQPDKAGEWRDKEKAAKNAEAKKPPMNASGGKSP